MSKEKQFPELPIESLIPFEVDSEAVETKSSFSPRSTDELEVEETEDEVEEEVEEVDVDDGEFSFAPFAKLLSENGLFEYDEENFEDSVDSLLEGYNKAVESSVKKVVDSYPDTVKELVEHINNG